MAKVLIVYASDYGNTERMAQAVAEGVNSIGGAEAVLKKADETTAEDVIAADALVLGSPIHMGSMDHRVKAFIDRVCGGLWMKDVMSGRVGAVFATGGGFGGAGAGSELTMVSMLNNMAELGMVLVPLPKHTPGYAKGGIQWGPHGRSAEETGNPTALTDEQLVSSRHHGANIARVTLALNGPIPFAR